MSDQSGSTKPTVIEVRDKADFDARLAAATGPVLVDFVADGCEACAGEKPLLDQLAGECAEPATILIADEAKVGGELFDAHKVDGTPTLLYAKDGAAFTAGKTVEVDPTSAALRRKLKCAR